MSNITVDALADIETAILIGEQLQDKSVLEQCAQLVSAEKKLYPKEHYRVVNALSLAANTCIALGELNNAVAYHVELYDILRKTAKNSAILSDVCNFLLAYSGDADKRWYRSVYETAKTASGDEKSSYYYACGLYGRRILATAPINLQELNEATDNITSKLTLPLDFSCQHGALEVLSILGKCAFDFNLDSCYQQKLIEGIRSISNTAHFSQKNRTRAKLYLLYFKGLYEQRNKNELEARAIYEEVIICSIKNYPTNKYSVMLPTNYSSRYLTNTKRCPVLKA